MQYYFVRGLFMFVCAIALLRYFRRFIKRLYNQIDAWFQVRMMPFYNRRMATRKEKLFAELLPLSKLTKQRITILEIGSGGGSNLCYFPDNSFVMCIDPNPYFAKYVLRVAEQRPELKLEFVQGFAEDMRNIPSESVDAVIATLVLCTVRNIDNALIEIRRVLKPVSTKSLHNTTTRYQKHTMTEISNMNYTFYYY